MNKFFRNFLILFFVTLFNMAANAQDIKNPVQLTPWEQVVNFCKKYDGDDLEFLQNLSQKILADKSLREAFLRGLKVGNLPECRNALADHMKRILKDDDGKYRRGMQAYVSLALLANIPSAKQLIEQEMDTGNLTDFIDILEKTDKNFYYLLLSRWVDRVGQQIRAISKAKKREEDQYGRLAQSDDSNGTLNMLPIWTPILMNRYLTEAIAQKGKLNTKEFSNLNMIYSVSTGPNRDIFYNQIAQLVNLNTKDWIHSFRTEQPWVQFRLFPLLKQPQNGSLKRELIWLAQYHQDGRIRLLAQNTLNGFAKK